MLLLVEETQFHGCLALRDPVDYSLRSSASDSEFGVGKSLSGYVGCSRLSWRRLYKNGRRVSVPSFKERMGIGINIVAWRCGDVMLMMENNIQPSGIQYADVRGL